MSDKLSVEGHDYLLMRGQLPPASTIVAIGGGKGGVGKSFVSSSLAIFLSQLGHKTTIVDLDIGAANLHTCLGEGVPQVGINEFLQDPKIQIEDIQMRTRFPNLHLISGASEVLGVADVNEEQKSRLCSSLYRLKTDFIILDLSAGTHDATLDFFLMASRKLVVLTPEPSSMENAYRFMKSAFYRRLRRYEFQLKLSDTIRDIMADRKTHGVNNPADLVRILGNMQPESGAKLQRVLHDINFEIILNQVRSLQDIDLGSSIQSVSHKYFGVPSEFLGHLEYDNAVWQSLRKRRHLLIEYPHSRLYAQLMAMSRKLIQDQAQRVSA